MYVFNHPYVGTEHFFLAFLKKYKLKSVSFEEFKGAVKDIIGYGTIKSTFVLYTPILREIKNKYKNEKDAIVAIIENEDSIVHSILVVKKKDTNGLIEEIKNLS